MRVLIYAAILLAVLLLALFLVMVLIGWIASHVAPISAVRGFDGFFAGVAVGVPLLLLASAAILAVARALPPLLTAQRTARASLAKIPHRPLVHRCGSSATAPAHAAAADRVAAHDRSQSH